VLAQLSVIVPAYGSAGLDVCLASIRASHYSDYELLIADDGSPDPAIIDHVATAYGARVIRLEVNSGPAAARNAAARAAGGELLVFFDSDVTLHGDTLRRIADRFSTDPELDALMGSYDFEPAQGGFVAAFRNLLHAWVHHRSAGEASTFWGACGAVRRERFLHLGGFDESYRRPSVEDVEFGMRLHRAGARILLDPAIEVKHHKAWGIGSMLFTDAVRRAIPWTHLLMKYGTPRGLNFRGADRASTAAACAAVLAAVVSPIYGAVCWIAAAVALIVMVLLQWDFFRFLIQQRGVAFGAASVPLYLAHSLAGAIGFGVGLLMRPKR